MDTFTRLDTPVKFVGAGEVPPYGAMRVTGTEAETGALTVDVPNADSMPAVLINGGTSIAAGGYGVGAWAPKVIAAYSGTAPAANGPVGTKAGQFPLEAGKIGFTAFKAGAGGVVECVRYRSATAYPPLATTALAGLLDTLGHSQTVNVNLTNSGTLRNAGAVTLDSSLAVAGASVLHATTTTTLHATGAATLDSTLGVVGSSTFVGPVTIGTTTSIFGLMGDVFTVNTPTGGSGTAYHALRVVYSGSPYVYVGDVATGHITGLDVYGPIVVSWTTTDLTAVNGSIYYSATQSALAFKDPAGAVHVLYPPSGVALTGASNTFTDGPNTFQTGAPGDVGIVVQGAASQTADLQQWKDSGGGVLASVSAAGALTLGTPLTEANGGTGHPTLAAALDALGGVTGTYP